MDAHLTDDQRRAERRRGRHGSGDTWGFPGGRRRGGGFGPGGGCGPGGEHHGPHHHRGFGPFGRARRGMIKAAVFAALAEEPMHGYQIMQRIEELSGGAWRPSPGSVYPTLQELEDRDLVKSEEVEGKRIYSLTETGAAEADKLRDVEGNLPWMTAEGPAGTRMKLRQAIGGLAAAARQVGMSGSDDMVEKTLAILADARKRIYALLAEGE
jgi:DNA-binding PadR family transcriptional regulator